MVPGLPHHVTQRGNRRMQTFFEDWPWSSAAAHVAGRGDAVAEGDWLAERIASWICTWRMAESGTIQIS